MASIQKIIIDGYNVVYTDERLRRTACRDLEQARRRLLQRLESYIGNRRIQVTVVFDGRGGLADTEVVVPGRLQVVYSAAGQTADELIVSTLEKLPNPGGVIVVTSDMADIGRAARGMGCTVTGSKRFLDQMARGQSAEGAVTGDTGQDTVDEDVGDTDYWLERFRETDEPTSDGSR